MRTYLFHINASGADISCYQQFLLAVAESV